MNDTSNINMDMTGGKLPKSLLNKVQSADTTNITNITKKYQQQCLMKKFHL